MKTNQLLFGLILSIAAAGCGSDGGGGDDGTGPDAPAQAACSLVGTWNLPARGGAPPMFVVHDGGTWDIALGTIGSKTGTWSVSGDHVSFTDTGATGAGTQSQCPSAQVGTYSMVYSADCNTLTTHLVSDPCAARVTVVDNMTATR